jgi:hypothetical protein
MTGRHSRKIAFGASETLALAGAIGARLGIPWSFGKDPKDAVLVDAAYAALQSLEAAGVTFGEQEQSR